jgi:hypothetical protein
MKKTIYPNGRQWTRGVYSPAISIDVGNAELIFVSWQQVAKNENNEAITDDIVEQTIYIWTVRKNTECSGSKFRWCCKGSDFSYQYGWFCKSFCY